MKFDELWKYQQGALFLKKDMIYDLRKDLASYFYEAGYYDAKEEMSYDVHTCHNKCTRLMCVQRREITELTRKLEVAEKALRAIRKETDGGDQTSLELNAIYLADDALKELE